MKPGFLTPGAQGGSAGAESSPTAAWPPPFCYCKAVSFGHAQPPGTGVWALLALLSLPSTPASS